MKLAAFSHFLHVMSLHQRRGNPDTSRRTHGVLGRQIVLNYLESLVVEQVYIDTISHVL